MGFFSRFGGWAIAIVVDMTSRICQQEGALAKRDWALLRYRRRDYDEMKNLGKKDPLMAREEDVQSRDVNRRNFARRGVDP